MVDGVDVSAETVFVEKNATQMFITVPAGACINFCSDAMFAETFLCCGHFSLEGLIYFGSKQYGVCIVMVLLLAAILFLFL